MPSGDLYIAGNLETFGEGILLLMRAHTLGFHLKVGLWFSLGPLGWWPILVAAQVESPWVRGGFFKKK